MLETVLQTAGLLVVTLSNLLVLVIAPTLLGARIVFSKRLWWAGVFFYIPQILAALALWYYSEASSRNVSFLVLVAIPMSNLIYFLTKPRETSEYSLVRMCSDMTASIICFVAALQIYS